MQIFSHTIPFEGSSEQLLDIFKNEPNLFLLDSSLQEGVDGRFSYLGFAPFKTIKLKNFKALRKAIKPYLGLTDSSTLASGAVGYLGYEGDMWFGLYDGIVGIDHQSQTITIAATGLPYQDRVRQKCAAQQKIDYIVYKIMSSLPRRQAGPKSSPPKADQPLADIGDLVHAKAGPPTKTFGGDIRRQIKNSTSKVQYIQAVKKALRHIFNGDIYQINLSHRFECDVKGDGGVEIYKNLRSLSPSTFSAYLNDGAHQILSSSPERFLKFSQGVAQVRPMKGTRPRGRNPEEDQKNREELLNSTKERAELLMVTDLERNDLGRVCHYGSVHVKNMRTIEEYATVFQATSTVEGVLKKSYDQFDLLESTFPSGSVTGCPKIEAMKIIRKLEKSRRGFYTGALGYINFNGDMDFNVLIRTLFLEKKKISFYVGGGIVADSDPKKEYEETLVKAQAMVEALNRSL